MPFSGTLTQALTGTDTTMTSAELAQLPTITAASKTRVWIEAEPVWVIDHPAGVPTATIVRGGGVAHAVGAVWHYSDELLSASGQVSLYAGVVAPAGYLICNGTSYLRAQYPDLYAAIGTTYGSVDSTHFNVPNLKGRVPLGKDVADNLGATGGSRGHNHTTPSLSHSAHSGADVDAHSGTTVGTSGSGSSHSHLHTHGVGTYASPTSGAEAAHTHTQGVTGAPSTQATNLGLGLSSAASTTHTHTQSATNAGTSHTHAGGTVLGASASDATAETAHTHASGSVTQPANHAVTQPSAHSDHAAGTSGVGDPAYLVLHYIIRT